MTQTALLGQVPDGTGLTVRQAFNACDVALATMHEGVSPPAQTYPNMMWYDETNGHVRRRSADGTTWNILRWEKATRAPDVNDDVTWGYVTGSIVCDVANSKVYVCRSPADGAAEWVELGAGSGNSLTLATQPEAEAGVENTHYMTSLRTAQAITARVPDAAAGVKGRISLSGQISGTAAAPKVVGIRETSGPTDLGIGAVGDGQYLMRSGSAIVGGTPSGGGDVPASRSVATAGSLTGGGDLSSDRTLSLTNDSASPGNSKLYGTNGAGVKGWYDQPTGGGGSANVTLESWTIDEEIGSTVDTIVARGGNTRVTLPAAAGSPINAIAVYNDADAAIDLRAWDGISLINGNVYPEDGTAYSAHHVLSGASASASGNKMIVSFWCYLASTLPQAYVIFEQAVSSTDVVRIRTSGDNAASWTNKHLAVETTDAGISRVDRRYVMTPEELHHVAVALDLSVPVIKARIDGVLVTDIGGGTLLAGNIGGGGTGVCKVASAVPGTRRAWCGGIAGLQAWRGVYHDLAVDQNFAMHYDKGPTQTGFAINGVAPFVIYNSSGTTFANPGSIGGTWTDATPAGVTAIPNNETYAPLTERITGGDLIIPVGGARSLLRAAGRGRWRAAA